jgi:hypothetical protein
MSSMLLYTTMIIYLSRALRVKHETSISEYLVREWGPHLELGVGLRKAIYNFISHLADPLDPSLYYCFTYYFALTLGWNMGTNNLLV